MCVHMFKFLLASDKQDRLKTKDNLCFSSGVYIGCILKLEY